MHWYWICSIICACILVIAWTILALGHDNIGVAGSDTGPIVFVYCIAIVLGIAFPLLVPLSIGAAIYYFVLRKKNWFKKLMKEGF